MSETIVQAKSLAREYKRGKIPIPAVNGIDLDVRKGEIVAIIGPSGSGKTTMLNLIGGLDRPTSGRIVVDGVDLEGMNDKQLTEYRLRKIGFVFQFYNLMPTLTAEENVELPMILAGIKDRGKRYTRANELLRTVGLEGRKDHKPEELSGGEQQRVAIARALANTPSVILGDEPTGDLDSKSAKSLMDLVRSLQGITFILVTHDPLVLSSCDRAFSLRDGKVTRELSKEDIMVEREKMDVLF